ncbi:MAG: tRNA uridine-5-carboxymethylaminomethyl(34) synthesis enzyme MnmG, partial [Planctomycetes bacterium]|nr:tRNA uridine-5-carboxymethylaminomethyl(34) synthesis enzyme MnmG [Planctomycetota bacterium]
YEESAAQGLYAGIQVALRLRGEPSLVLDRASSYLGVLVDDLCRVHPREPYRMFTSRAENRLMLRHGNADLRLGEIGARIGLLDARERDRIVLRRERIDAAVAKLGSTWHDGKTLAARLRVPGVTLSDIAELRPECGFSDFGREDREEIEARILYEPYHERAQREQERLDGMRDRRFPENLDFRSLTALKHEARDMLDARRPRTLGEAMRLPGVTPADVSVLLVELERRRRSGAGQPS